LKRKEDGEKKKSKGKKKGEEEDPLDSFPLHREKFSIATPLCATAPSLPIHEPGSRSRPII